MGYDNIIDYLMMMINSYSNYNGCNIYNRLVSNNY